MINLMPPEIKTAYIYGRKNLLLRKWVVAFVVALIGLGVIGTFGLLTLHQTTLEHNQKVAIAEKNLDDNDYKQTQERVKDISSSFKLVVKVLGQEVLFSQLLKQIATVIPKNANLTGLNISQTQGGIDISAVAKDYNTASQVQVNLADPKNAIFSKADIISITCQDGQTSSGSNSDALTSGDYPCSVNVRALFAPNNPFLFINSKGVKP